LVSTFGCMGFDLDFGEFIDFGISVAHIEAVAVVVCRSGVRCMVMRYF